MPTILNVDWIKHGDDSGSAAILGIDIDAHNERLATCGADCKVRIWAMRSVLSGAKWQDDAEPAQLAVLTDFHMPVNCVRFAPSGDLVAAGSDDAGAFIYELHEGRGSTIFGSDEIPNVENWRLRLVLRDHASNVTDVAWSPDGRYFATSSVDNEVKVWSVSTGHCLHRLIGHRGHVKGVAWDPLNIFLASQGDRETIIWRLQDGELVARLLDPFTSAPEVCFAQRPSWSPDGKTLALSNGYDLKDGVHTVALVRMSASAPDVCTLIGHTGPVTVVRFNPHLRHHNKQKGAGDTGEGVDVGAVLAVGSIDRLFSVWHLEVAKPLMVSDKCAARMITDMAWSPDGRVLAVASLDGTAVLCVFDDGELGQRVSNAEMGALQLDDGHSAQCGDQGSDHSEAQEASERLLQAGHRPRSGGRVDRPGNLPATAVGAAGPCSSAVGALLQQANSPSSRPERRPAARASDSPMLSNVGCSTCIPSNRDRDPDRPPAKRAAVQPRAAYGPLAWPAIEISSRTPSGVGLTDTGATAGWAQDSRALVPPPPIMPRQVCVIHKPSRINDRAQGEIELEIRNDCAGTSCPRATVSCVAQCSPQWTDRVQGHVVACAGSCRMAAVSTTHADLLVWSPAGRRLFPPLCLGSSAAFLSVAPDSMLLLALLTDGRVRMWDWEQPQCIVDTCVRDLLLAPEGGGSCGQSQHTPLKVTAARISTCGRPVVLLSNGQAYMYHLGMRSWVRVADEASSSALAAGFDGAEPGKGTCVGEVSRLQAAAAAQRLRARHVPAWSAQHAAGAIHNERAALENNMAVAVLLESPVEWGACLRAYVRRLILSGDEVRLRELISDLLGPPSCTPDVASKVGSKGGGSVLGVSGSPVVVDGLSSGQWQPSILGLDKRLLLRNAVLKELAMNAKYQSLVAQVMEQLGVEDGLEPVQTTRHVAGGMAGLGAGVAVAKWIGVKSAGYAAGRATGKNASDN